MIFPKTKELFKLTLVKNYHFGEMFKSEALSKEGRDVFIGNVDVDNRVMQDRLIIYTREKNKYFHFKVTPDFLTDENVLGYIEHYIERGLSKIDG